MEGKIDSFTTLGDFLEESDESLAEAVKGDISEHLLQLREAMEHYFPKSSLDRQTTSDWIRNHFEASGLPGVSGRLLDQLTELQCSRALREKFARASLDEFWVGASKYFPALSDIALRSLIPFVSTYLCESGFSIYVATKNKYRNRLDAENDMRLQL